MTEHDFIMWLEGYLDNDELGYAEAILNKMKEIVPFTPSYPIQVDPIMRDG